MVKFIILCNDIIIVLYTSDGLINQNIYKCIFFNMFHHLTSPKFISFIRFNIKSAEDSRLVPYYSYNKCVFAGLNMY